ncbi:hypothetical protein CRUP_020336 [Coryphaenoides rupestris]|nr:hypothetical protein CRUP_020336 [Coryphaenoides rupestris]
MWVGLSSNGTNQFNGRMQDFRFYPAALTNREIVELHTGVLPRLHTQSECRCPPSHPRVHPLVERYCIPNAVEDTTANRVLRLNLNGHPLSYVNDQDMGTSWLSRTLTTQEDLEDGLTITLDLANGQYQVFYVIVQFGGLLPERVVIQRRSGEAPEPQNHDDTGKPPWTDWQYMARDCSVFNMQDNGPLPAPNSVNCLQLPRDAPLSGGNITFALLTPEPHPRPGYNDFYNSPELQRMVQATQVRVLLSGQYHSEAVGMSHGHRYYAISEITISGRCECHGHADQCDTRATLYRCACLPESHTEGNNCERCLPLYNDKPFRSGNQFQPMSCRRCQCNGHARSCHYDVSADHLPGEHYRGGGGVCDNCMHNTTGLSCDRCEFGFWNRSQADGCVPCDCNPRGSLSAYCEQQGGQCACRPGVGGLRCTSCGQGTYSLGLDGSCLPCNCSAAGTIGGAAECDPHTGQCVCKENTQGRRCDSCRRGYHSLDHRNSLGCLPCACDPAGTAPGGVCDAATGQCPCRRGVEGSRCTRCAQNYYYTNSSHAEGKAPGEGRGAAITSADANVMAGAPAEGGPRGCVPCTCDPRGSVEGTPCVCDPVGSVNRSCHPDTGVCVCKGLVTGDECNLCLPGASHMDPDNHLGCSKAPSQQPPPSGVVLSVSSIRLSWLPPDSPNSHTLNYTLMRDALPVYSLQSQHPYRPESFEDTGLRPYTSHSYWLRTSSVAGQTDSAAVSYETLAAVPDARQFQLKLLGSPGQR